MLKVVRSLVFAGLAAFVSVAFCHAEDAPAVVRLDNVGFGFGTPSGARIQAIAHANGFIADEFKGTPTELEFTYFTGTGPAINQALSNGRLDFA